VTEAAEASPPTARPLRSIVSAMVVLAMVALAVAGLKSWRDYDEARTRETRLRSAIAESEKKIQALEKRIERLRDDPVTLDRVAREELGLVRPDEVVIVLPETPTGKRR
jgi:cell division protein FtsB